jgi:hypothetical protein
MPYGLQVDELRRLVVVAVTGVVDKDIAEPMVTQARAAAVAQGFNVLYDFRGATPNVDNTDIFWFPRRISALQSPQAPRVKAVLLHLPQYRALGQHWENTLRNVGLQVRAFEDEEAALAWLSSPP